MALTCKVVNFDASTGGGTQNVAHGLGAAPKVLIFLYNRASATGFSTQKGMGMGWWESSGPLQRCVFGTSNDGSSAARSRMDDGAVIFMLNGAGTTLADGRISATDATNFTITWDTTPAAAYDITVLCLTGTDISNTKIGTITLPSADDTAFDTTGVGFQPDLVMLSATGTGTAVNTTNASIDGFSFGGMDYGGRQGVIYGDGVDFFFNRNSERIERTDKCAIVGNAALGIALSASYVSMDADGFTINVDWVSGGTRPCFYFAMKFASQSQVRVIADLQPVSASAVNTAVTGQTPLAVLLASANKTTGSTLVADNQLSLGASDSTTEGAVWGGDDSAAEAADNFISATKALAMVNAASPSAVAAEADASFSAETLTLTWSEDTSDTAREWIGISFGDSTAVSVTIASVVSVATASANTATVTISEIVAAVVAAATTDALNPIVSISKAILSIVAAATADGLTPIISISKIIEGTTGTSIGDANAVTIAISELILAELATSTADGIAPAILAIMNATIASVGAAAAADVLAHIISISKAIISTIAEANAVGGSPIASISRVVQSALAEASADSLASAVLIGITIAGAVAEAQANGLISTIAAQRIITIIVNQLATATGGQWSANVNPDLTIEQLITVGMHIKQTRPSRHTSVSNRRLREHR